MPVDIQALRARRTTVDVDYYGETIEISYNPVKIAQPEFREEWQAKRRELIGEVGDWLTGLRDELRKIDLPDDFPGRDALIAAGITTIGDVPADREVLTAYDGINNARAQRIVLALNSGDYGVDVQDFNRRKDRVWAELAVMLAVDWGAEDDGSDPFTVDNVAALTGLGERICVAVQKDLNQLGNPKTSTTTG